MIDLEKSMNSLLLSPKRYQEREKESGRVLLEACEQSCRSKRKAKAFLVVTHIVKTSPAESAGIKVGDLLVRLGPFVGFEGDEYLSGRERGGEGGMLLAGLGGLKEFLVSNKGKEVEVVLLKGEAREGRWEESVLVKPVLKYNKDEAQWALGMVVNRTN